MRTLTLPINLCTLYDIQILRTHNIVTVTKLYALLCHFREIVKLVLSITKSFSSQEGGEGGKAGKKKAAGKQVISYDKPTPAGEKKGKL